MKKTNLEKSIKTIVLHTKPTEAESIAYAKEMRDRFPNKQDYGFGEAGHTLNDWKEMQELFRKIGPISAAQKSHTQLSQKYRKTVGKVIDEIIAESFICNSYLGKYCWSGTVQTFLYTNKESWLNQMITRHNEGGSPYELSSSQKEAWNRCYTPLKKAFQNHSEKHKDLLVVFEYALPGRVSKKNVIKLIWPDVLLVGKEKIIVIEFKNKPLSSEAIEQYLAQANKYKRRLEKYHMESAHKQIDCVLVSTQMKKTQKVFADGVFCSGDCLDLIIQKAFPKATLSFDHSVWLESEFSGLT